MGDVYKFIMRVCTESVKKGGNYSRGDINQGNMYLNFDFFLNQAVPDLRRVGLLFMLCAQMEA